MSRSWVAPGWCLEPTAAWAEAVRSNLVRETGCQTIGCCTGWCWGEYTGNGTAQRLLSSRLRTSVCKLTARVARTIGADVRHCPRKTLHYTTLRHKPRDVGRDV